MRSKNFKELEGWTLPELLEFLTMIRPHIRRAGFELGVTGSVLFEGKSDHDGDVVVYPRDSSSFDLSVLYSVLEQLGLNLEFSHAELLKIWRMKKSNDIKHVEAWSYKGKRIDLFIFR
jgi:predicted nucleotidyltransferase